jgi:hypothetical protein
MSSLFYKVKYYLPTNLNPYFDESTRPREDTFLLLLRFFFFWFSKKQHSS